jgi:hypothetical protein
MPLPGARLSWLACSWLLVTWMVGCATTPPPDLERRVAEAQRGLEEDPAVEARREAVQAAVARERGEVALDEFEFRVRGQARDGDSALGMKARIPVPDPARVRARRAERRAETEASIARLDETSLRRRAEFCFRSMESHAHRERSAIYEFYARRQRALLEWNEQSRRSGIESERRATQFRIEARIKLATRKPGPPPEPSLVTDPLPPLGRGQGRLVTSAELLLDLVRSQHPSPAVHRAIAARYEALAARAQTAGRPWFEFVDVDYERIFGDQSRNDIGGQLAFQIPFGVESRADASRFRALGRSETLEAEGLIQDQMRQSMFALREFQYFESNTEEWQELLELARSAEEVAERWGEERLARPSQLENLIDRAYDARVAVLEERERAGLARCTVLALTGVSLDDWPRE